MGRWRDSWAARNPSVRLARPMALTRLPLWFRATGSSALMEVLPDMAARYTLSESLSQAERERPRTEGRRNRLRNLSALAQSGGRAQRWLLPTTANSRNRGRARLSLIRGQVPCSVRSYSLQRLKNSLLG